MDPSPPRRHQTQPAAAAAAALGADAAAVASRGQPASKPSQTTHEVEAQAAVSFAIAGQVLHGTVSFLQLEHLYESRPNVLLDLQ